VTQRGDDGADARFTRFVDDHEPRLRRALVATLGPDDGREATAAALAWAWEHRDRLDDIDHPVPYLYRVGQSSQRRRREPMLLPAPPDEMPLIEPGLLDALRALTEHQRVAVLLVHGYGWTHREAADLLGIRPSSLRNHLRRALAHLRAALEVDIDA
jgi:DNA-directed RNA polymerase specialized sigma24 family protein